MIVRRQSLGLTPVCAGGLVPGLHHHKCTLMGENRLGTKMEMMERKYSTACAKINYKTFTFFDEILK